MRLLDWPALAQDYAGYHLDARNRLCHAVGIPLIVLCMLRWLPLVALALPLYLVWDVKLGVVAVLAAAILAAAAFLLPAALLPWLFALGWALQFWGHWRYEGKSPAFARNLVHLLVGPLYILRETFVAKYLR